MLKKTRAAKADDRSAAVIVAEAAALRAYFLRRGAGDAADDLLSETFMVAWRRRDQLPDDTAGARMWLFGIARLVLSNANRSMRRREALTARLRSQRQPVPTSVPAEEHIEVREAIATLDEDAAELIRLVHWEGFSVVEAANVLSLNPSTARSRYNSAKKKLRTALGIDHGPDRPDAAAITTVSRIH